MNTRRLQDPDPPQRQPDLPPLARTLRSSETRHTVTLPGAPFSQSPNLFPFQHEEAPPAPGFVAHLPAGRSYNLWEGKSSRGHERCPTRRAASGDICAQDAPGREFCRAIAELARTGRFAQLRSVLPAVVYDELWARYAADPAAFVVGLARNWPATCARDLFSMRASA